MMKGVVVVLDRYIRFSHSIAEIYKSIQKLERKEMERYGLRGPHVQCLMAVQAHPEGITAAQLCGLCEKDKAAVSRAVSELEQQGLLIRDSGYRANLSLSAQGASVTDRIRRTAETAARRVSIHITDQDRSMFYHALDQIGEDLRAMCEDGIPDPGYRKETL